ncbi:MAG TPA: hypothetical protein VNF07_08365 [Acidimicrobiales bacterium]|nr:hypothetical protein [Acidimicrobiales bacterium]
MRRNGGLTGRALPARLALLGLLTTTAALASAGGVGATGAGVTAQRYPVTLLFGRIVVRGGGLFLTGTVAATGGASTNCLMAGVDPVSLALGRISEPECDSPALSGATVAPAEFRTTAGYSDRTTARAVLVGADGGVAVGAALFTYQSDSASALLTAASGGSVWVFEGAATPPSLVRLSAATGRVLQVATFPSGVARSVMVADSDGAYLAPAGDGWGAPSVIYRVAIGARRPVVVRTLAGPAPADGYVNWMAADGHALWADLCTRAIVRPPYRCAVWRFQGPDLTPVFHAPDVLGTAAWVTGSAATGFYSSIPAPWSPPGPRPSEVAFVRVDPASGAERVAAAVPLSSDWRLGGSGHATQAVVFDRALYLLDGADGYGSGPATLHRVPLG